MWPELFLLRGNYSVFFQSVFLIVWGLGEALNSQMGMWIRSNVADVDLQYKTSFLHFNLKFDLRLNILEIKIKMEDVLLNYFDYLTMNPYYN